MTKQGKDNDSEDGEKNESDSLLRRTLETIKSVLSIALMLQKLLSGL